MSDVFVCRYNQKKADKAEADILKLKDELAALKLEVNTKLDGIKADIGKLPK